MKIGDSAGADDAITDVGGHVGLPGVGVGGLLFRCRGVGFAGWAGLW